MSLFFPTSSGWMTVSLPLFFFISLPPFDFCTGWSGPAIVEQGFYIPSLFFGSRRLCGSVWEYDGAKLHLPFSFQVRRSFFMAASSSKARARPIPRDLSSSDESSQEVLADSNIPPRQQSLLSPKLPRLHSIKGPFKLVLGGILTNPVEAALGRPNSNSSSASQTSSVANFDFNDKMDQSIDL